MSAISAKAAQFLIRAQIADALNGDIEALFDLGVTYSAGRYDLERNLIESHKWFNLAALNGCERSQLCRAEISYEMTAREIALAQRNARNWLANTQQHLKLHKRLTW